MQHVLRCWERQSDGSEYKKTLRRPGLRPGPRWGSLQRSRRPRSCWGGAGCPLPNNPIPRSRPFGPRLSYPNSKISSDTVVVLSFHDVDHRRSPGMFNGNRFARIIGTYMVVSFCKICSKIVTKRLENLVVLLSGHNTLNRHLTLLKIEEDPMCPLCGEEYDTSLHLSKPSRKM